MQTNKKIHLIIHPIKPYNSSSLTNNSLLNSLQPNDGKERKIHTALTKLFADPNNLQMYGTKEELEDTEDYFPYACVSIAIP